MNPTNAPGSEGEHYPIGGYLPDRHGIFGTVRENMKEGRIQPVHMWPTVIEATEVLIGAALVTAQEYIGNRDTTKAHEDIRTVANFWKHRDEWGLDWAKASRSKPNAKKPTTCEAIESLGEMPPMTAEVSLGQLTRLAKVALGEPFTVTALYDAIANIP